MVSLGDYSDSRLREWLLAMKHGGRRDLAWPLGRRLAREWLRRGRAGPVEEAVDVVVPVPLHPLRRFERGYDQARLLAEAAALGLGLPMRPLLHRTRATPPQGSPGVGSRAANLRGALRVRSGRKCDGLRALLVDDVVTSGATVGDAARALRSAGLRPIGVLTVARASGG